MARSLDVSSFAGQTVYVAFRHHNSTDWFRMNLDDISVRTIQANDVEMTSISTPTVSATGTNVTIAGTVTNKGANTITSLDVTWDDGSGCNQKRSMLTFLLMEHIIFTWHAIKCCFSDGI